MRAILEELPIGTDVTLVHRVRRRSEAVLGDELRALAAARGARLVTIEGTRVTTRSSWLPAQAGHLTDEQALLEITPDLAERDVIICGAPAWMDAVSAAARRAGLPADQLHVERFTY
jgi:ferredoxin-NADP reductase